MSTILPSSASALAPVIQPQNYSMVGSKPQDAQGSNVDSSIPTTQACADISTPSNTAGEITSSSSSSLVQLSNLEDSTPQALVQVAKPSLSSTDDISRLQESLSDLKLEKGNLLSNGDSSSQCASDTAPATLVPSSGDAPNTSLRESTGHTEDTSAQPSHPASSGGYDVLKRPVGSDGAEASPVIVVSSQNSASISLPPSTQANVEMLIDEPDQRLLDALENQRDRLFVIKLEQDVIDFIEKTSSDIFDMPPINAYHRLLTHKVAEYYRLTHVADTSGTSVRLYRGQFARMPPARLSDRRLPNAVPNPSAANGTKSNFKIMQRSPSNRGSDTPPEQQNGSSSKKTTSESSSGDGSARATTREEREQAYQEARARIFKDFVESPPETPAPPKSNEKSRKQEKPDEFHGRSQFYAVPTPAPPVNPYYFPQYEDPRLQGQNGTHISGGSRFNPSTPSFNPPSFVPPLVSFTPPQQPQPQSFMPPISNRHFPPQADRSFPAPNQGHVGLNMFPQQPRNGYYPEQGANFHNGNPQRSPLMMSNTFANQRFGVQPPPPHGQHSGPPIAAPIPGTTNRHPYASPSNYAVGNQAMGNQRFQVPQQQPLMSGNGWNTPQMVNGGIPMAARSQSALPVLDRPTPPFGGMPYQNHQQSQHWGGNSVVGSSAPTNFRQGPFGGAGGPGMHGPVGGM
ncbi:hypothetical protein L873DRAFT_1812676 [Choiromyces venosus 120613-1]|uniref:R3H domain-containing protein n=1 Tax=Choiromyces venosus 120613-1 TaxID=1336337 RepID=A0A3N4JBA4_9PEZI|nr:hypothetical protein L873DRAFT_1812676 [Choiromyces venosus 120613-1]